MTQFMVDPEEAQDRADEVTATLRRYRLPQATERQLQNGIATVLTSAKIAFERERALSARDRPDFMVAPGVCLEVKVGGSSAEVLRQLERYAESDAVAVLILITTRQRHVFPTEVGGKPLHTVFAGSAFR